MPYKGVTGSSNVQQVQLAGVVGRLPLSGVEDQPVLARGGEDVLRQAGVDALILVSRIPEAVDDPLQAIQSGRLEQRVVKQAVEAEVSSCVIRVRTRFALSQILVKIAQGLIAQMLDRMHDGEGLQGLAHHEDLQQLGRIQRPDPSTDVRLDDDEALAGKLSKGLSDRDSTGAALGGNSFLNNALSGHEVAIEDLLSQRARDARHRPECGRTPTWIYGGHGAHDWIQTLALDGMLVKVPKVQKA